MITVLMFLIPRKNAWKLPAWSTHRKLSMLIRRILLMIDLPKLPQYSRNEAAQDSSIGGVSLDQGPHLAPRGVEIPGEDRREERQEREDDGGVDLHDREDAPGGGPCKQFVAA